MRAFLGLMQGSPDEGMIAYRCLQWFGNVAKGA